MACQVPIPQGPTAELQVPRDMGERHGQGLRRRNEATFGMGRAWCPIKEGGTQGTSTLLPREQREAERCLSIRNGESALRRQGSKSDAVMATVGWTGMHRTELKHWSALETVMRKLGDRNKESDENTLMLKPNRRVMLSGAGASGRCSGREGAALVHLGQATQEDKWCGVYSAHSLGVESPQSRPPPQSVPSKDTTAGAGARVRV